jgi:hypothetical protein
VFIGEVLHTLEFDNEHVFDQDIGVVSSNIPSLIANGKRCLTGSPNAPETEFLKQGTFVHLFEESRAQDIGDLKDCAYHALGKRIWASAFIGG